jgi:phospholipase C
MRSGVLQRGGSVRRSKLLCTAALYAMAINTLAPLAAAAASGGVNDGKTTTPIKQVIVVIGENRSFDLFEGFVKKIVDMVKANKTLWASTAILIAMDEGGGYYDSGYVQQLDYFGDGTRIPMIVVSPYSKGGHISHTYADRVSVLKFIEANWNVPPITGRSRDNLPNPTTGADPYKPTNRPAIGDLTDLFKFPKP